jgi:hypothetical protein
MSFPIPQIDKEVQKAEKPHEDDVGDDQISTGEE